LVTSSVSRLRICIVTVAGYVHGIGGMQDHTVDLVRGLAAAGHEIEVISPRHPEGLDTAEHAGASWRFVDAPSRRARLPMRSAEWLGRSAALFASCHTRRPFDLVHSESTSALGLLRHGWHHRVPIVAKFHGNYLTFVRTSLRRVRARGDVLREAKGIVWISGAHFLSRGNWYAFRACEAMVPSLAQRDDTIRSHLLRASQVHVVPNGIDTAVFSPGDRGQARAQLGLGPGVVYVWLGRMYAGKGVEVAIRALARTESDVSLVLVGDGENRRALQTLATEVGVSARVHFAGAQARDRIPAYLRSADALVFPTLVPEAAPLTPLQAMACEVPVLASRIGSIPELVDEPGTNGLLVDPGDVAALARAMTAIAEDEQLRRRLGIAGRKRVLAEYTLERMIERTLAVYEVARARHARPPGAAAPASE
jgi:glycosyltransferase involved in cell wall biosynthesis